MTAGVSKRQRMPRIARVFGTLVVSTLALAGCVGQGSNSSNGGTGGGNKGGSHTLVIARNMDLIDTDPSTAICDTCQIVFAATYQTLVTLANDNHTLIPEVATSWSANANHAVWTFKLNPKARFSNGTPVTSADVKFSLLRLRNLAGSASYLVSFMKGVTTPDPHTAVVTLTRPDWEFPNQMSATYTSVLNSKEVQANGGTDAAMRTTSSTPRPGTSRRRRSHRWMPPCRSNGRSPGRRATSAREPARVRRGLQTRPGHIGCIRHVR